MNDFSKRVLSIDVSAIKEIAGLIKKDPEIISLAQGLPSFSTPKHIRDGVAAALASDEKGIGSYTLYSGTKQLKEAIAKKLERQIGRAIDAEKELFVTVGAMEGIAASILSLVNCGDEVILPSPNYGPHKGQVQIAGGKVVFCPLTRIAGCGWTWDINHLSALISAKTKLILFTNPGNPTGCLFDKGLLGAIVALAKKRDIWLFCDETYSFLTFEKKPFHSLATFSSSYEKIIVVRSFSKEYAMTGWRLGYVYAPKRFIPQALKIHDALVGCPPAISQKAAVLALTGSQQVVLDFRKELTFRRGLMMEKLSELSFYFDFEKPLGAYYILVRLKNNLSDVAFALKLINKAKVAVVPGSVFGPGGENHIRMCFAVSREDIVNAFERIRILLKK